MNKNLFLTFTVLATALTAYSQTYSGGMADDGLPHYNNNYPTYTPPAKGVSYTDPVFGSTVTRLTDGKADYNDAVHHEYASMNAFNANDSLVAVIGDNTGWKIIDLQGNVVISNPPGRGPRWSPVDPDIYYYYEYNDNKLKNIMLKLKLLPQLKHLLNIMLSPGVVAKMI